MAKYDPLRNHLVNSGQREVVMSFEELSNLVGVIPKSAKTHRAWWANESDGRHVQAQAWIGAGYEVIEVEQGERVAFRKF